MPDSVKITIAIDGYSSCGKSTLARDLANTLNYIFVDSGAMYRAISFYAIQNYIYKGGVLNREALIKNLPQINLKFIKVQGEESEHLLLNGEDITHQIRKNDVAQIVSEIATVPEVRYKLVELQKEFGKNGGIVMDGRDIGTVVFPNAELKLFVTADPQIRAKRRYKELIAKGENVNLHEITQNLLQRDSMDTQRAISPLKKANDAIIFDNSNLTREEQLQKAMDLVNQKMNSI